MKKWIIGVGAVLVLGVGAYTVYRFNSRSVSLHEVYRERREAGESIERAQYNKAWSEEETIKKEVEQYENYLVNWLATYVGRSGSEGQNTTSLKYTKMDGSKGRFNSITEVEGLYPNLAETLVDVSVSYSYSAGKQLLTQAVSLRQEGSTSPKVVYVIYDSSGTVQDYYYVNLTNIRGGV